MVWRMTEDSTRGGEGLGTETIRRTILEETAGLQEKMTVFALADVDEFPVLYACGGTDASDLCKEAFSDESAELIGDYSYLKLPTCGHDVLGCPDQTAAQQLIDAIIANIVSTEGS